MNSSSKYAMIAIADEMGGKVLVLSPLEIAESDETYISKMYDNLESLKVALCQES